MQHVRLGDLIFVFISRYEYFGLFPLKLLMVDVCFVAVLGLIAYGKDLSFESNTRFNCFGFVWVRFWCIT